MLYLDLSRNRIRDEGAIQISKIKTLQELNVSDCCIEDQGAAALFKNPSLKILDMNFNLIYDEGLCTLPANQTLTTLDLSQNCISFDNPVGISVNPSLRILDLSHNYIEDNGALALANNQNLIGLVELNLSNNRIKEPGFLALCQKTSLEFLSLFCNKISFIQTQPLPSSTKLTTLSLDYNNIADAPEEPLNSFFSSFPSLNTLGISGNKMSDECRTRILSQLKKKGGPSFPGSGSQSAASSSSNVPSGIRVVSTVLNILGGNIPIDPIEAPPILSSYNNRKKGTSKPPFQHQKASSTSISKKPGLRSKPSVTADTQTGKMSQADAEPVNQTVYGPQIYPAS